MIDRRTVMMALLATVPGVIASRQAVAQGGMSRITAYAFRFPDWPAATSGSPNSPAVRS